jgi:CYTH domain-containing protein
MGKEIERKFLVTSNDWKFLSEKKLYRQGYLAIYNQGVVRIRTVSDKGYLTIKSQRTNLSRDEFEYEIPFKDAEYMLGNLCLEPLVEKYRTKINFNGMIWEIDEFIGENEGLVVAEIELEDENQKIDLPPWIGTEVTNDPKYYNSNLVNMPYYKWRI